VAKKRGNPNWGKPEVNIIPYTGASSFEEVVRQLRLPPAEYEGSIHKYPTCLPDMAAGDILRRFREAIDTTF
jgi:hypothetical protein